MTNPHRVAALSLRLRLPPLPSGLASVDRTHAYNHACDVPALLAFWSLKSALEFSLVP
jgi:hypothetical protein